MWVTLPQSPRWVIEFYRKNPEALANLRAPLFEDKVIDFIVEMAKVTDRPVSIEDLLRPEDEPEDDSGSVEAAPTEEAAKPKRKPRKKAEKTES